MKKQAEKLKKPLASTVEGRVMPPRLIAWGCKTCNKIDWADAEDQLAKPEHVAHRGIDIGTCKGKMIPLYGA